MRLRTQPELEREGRPSRRELAWATIAIPFLLTVLTVWTHRVWRSFDGHPLEISGLLGISVRKAGPTWHYIGGLAFYAVLIIGCFLVLWACALQMQRWLYWRDRS